MLDDVGISTIGVKYSIVQYTDSFKVIDLPLAFRTAVADDRAVRVARVHS